MMQALSALTDAHRGYLHAMMVRARGVRDAHVARTRHDDVEFGECIREIRRRKGGKEDLVCDVTFTIIVMERLRTCFSPFVPT